MKSFQETIFRERYAITPEETWEQCAMRVATHIARAETTAEKESLWRETFYKTIAARKLIPGGRILYGSGRKINGLINCFAVDVEDNRESIAKLMGDVYKITCSGGGVGCNYSKIRPKGDPIQGIPGSAPGSIEVMSLIDSVGAHARAGNSRRCALMSMLRIDHPDILDFITVKTNLQRLNNMNISLQMTKDFVDAVKEDRDWSFKFNGREYAVYVFEREGERILVPAFNKEDAEIRAYQFHRQSHKDVLHYAGIQAIKAKDLFKRIVDNAISFGEPGMIFLDGVQRNFAAGYYSNFVSTNPCGEVPLDAYGNCCLSSINLESLVKNGVFDYEEFKRTIQSGIRFLDDVLSINEFPLKETKESSDRSRRIGLGIVGLHYALIRMGLRYGSTESIRELEKIFETLRNTSFEYSSDLAVEKGSFPMFDSDKYLGNEFIQRLPEDVKEKIRKQGIRNVNLNAIAPTGTISSIMGISSGLEPIFAPAYVRRWKQNNVTAEMVVLDPLLEEFLKAGKSTGFFVGAYDVTPEEHLRVQAIAQKYIDQSISKTINLPGNYTTKDLENLILEFSGKIKGLTVYKQGSRGMEPITPIPLTDPRIKLTKTSQVVVQECTNGVCNI